MTKLCEVVSELPESVLVRLPQDVPQRTVPRAISLVLNVIVAVVGVVWLPRLDASN